MSQTITSLTPPSQKKQKPLSKTRIFFGLVSVVFSIAMVLAFSSYMMHWRVEQSQADDMLEITERSSNLLGKVGTWLGNTFIFNTVGIAAFVVAFLVFVLGVLILKKPFFKPWKTISHSLFFIYWLPIFMGAITGGTGVLSGVYGFQITDFLISVIGKFGLWMILLTSILFYFIFEFNLRLSTVISKYNTLKGRILNNKATRRTTDPEIEVSTVSPIVGETVETIPPPTITENKTQETSPSSVMSKEVNTTSCHITEPQKNTQKSFSEASDDSFNFKVKVAKVKDDLTEYDQKSAKLVERHGHYDHTLELAHFKMPPLSLLRDYGNEEIAVNKEELEENKNKIVGLLKNFNVAISEIRATIGPTVTLYEIVPEAGIRVSAVKKLQDDIALNLSALGIRIIAPMPGKGTIGIEVPRKSPATVSMKSVLASPKFQKSDMDLPLVFGKTISNEIFMADLAKMPHLLMAGATGQGKSVGINAMLTSLLYKKHPSELKFVMVDPKKVELTLYSKIEKHYLAKLPDAENAIITDTTKVIDTLDSLCTEMDERYELLKTAFCRTIKEYNQKFRARKLNPENGHKYLPYIVLVVDEFADLIMTAGKKIEQPIARLAQLARAVGIHLIVATQRPSVNVITGTIKANFPARAAFRVISGVDSRTILDSPGADQLIGNGDMLYFNGNEILRLQCAFIDTPEVEKIVDYIGKQQGYPSAFLLPESKGEGSGSAGKCDPDEKKESGSAGFDPYEKDARFEEAAKIVVSTQQGSASMLQSRMKLGYNRARRIMDQLEDSRIVGSSNGAKAREVLVTDLMELEQCLENLKNNPKK
ncbi:MAG: DNA translocase FtsK [Bergeyella sp.]|nr:DNA translocase FtsK [Bergeyella sp.]